MGAFIAVRYYVASNSWRFVRVHLHRHEFATATRYTTYHSKLSRKRGRVRKDDGAVDASDPVAESYDGAWRASTKLSPEEWFAAASDRSSRAIRHSRNVLTERFLSSWWRDVLAACDKLFEKEPHNSPLVAIGGGSWGAPRGSWIACPRAAIKRFVGARSLMLIVGEHMSCE